MNALTWKVRAGPAGAGLRRALVHVLAHPVHQLESYVGRSEVNTQEKAKYVGTFQILHFMNH